MNVKMPAIDK